MKKKLSCTLALATIILGALPMAASAQQLYTVSPNQKNVWTQNGWAYPDSTYRYTTMSLPQNFVYSVQATPYIYSSPYRGALSTPSQYSAAPFISSSYPMTWGGGFMTNAGTYSYLERAIAPYGYSATSQAYSTWIR